MDMPTVTYFTCPEWLRRRGMLLDGGAMPEPRPSRQRILIKDIQCVVAEYYCIPLAEMTSERRASEVARPRQLAMWLSKQLTPRSLPEIGRYFHRDHTTVIHAVRQVEKRRADAHVENDLEKILHLLMTFRIRRDALPSFPRAGAM